uniref:Uncharacterized protein n=1 Tax=Globodera rostochiensis TaxID=31243 RepID=A0A914GXJ4_GLORO
MHPMFCFVVLAAIVGIEGQLENVEPKKDDSTAGIGLQLENVDLKKDDKEWTRAMEEEVRKEIEKRLKDLPSPSVFMEVLDVGNCRKTVKAYCPCGWAKCVPRANYSCTNELTKCCPVNYDLKCCESEKECIKACIQRYDKQWGARQRYDLCKRSCRREKVLSACNCIKREAFYTVNDCVYACVGKL